MILKSQSSKKFHCPETIYFERNRQRTHSIPEKVLIRQLEQMEFPELDESDQAKPGTARSRYSSR